MVLHGQHDDTEHETTHRKGTLHNGINWNTRHRICIITSATFYTGLLRALMLSVIMLRVIMLRVIMLVLVML